MIKAVILTFKILKQMLIRFLLSDKSDTVHEAFQLQ